MPVFGRIRRNALSWRVLARAAVVCLFVTGLWGGGVWAQSGATDSVFFFSRFVSLDDVSSSVILINPDRQDAIATLTLRDGRGAPVQLPANPATVRVPALGQTVATPTVFRSTTAFDGWLEVRSSTPGL